MQVGIPFFQKGRDVGGGVLQIGRQSVEEGTHVCTFALQSLQSEQGEEPFGQVEERHGKQSGSLVGLGEVGRQLFVESGVASGLACPVSHEQFAVGKRGADHLLLVGFHQCHFR